VSSSNGSGAAPPIQFLTLALYKFIYLLTYLEIEFGAFYPYNMTFGGSNFTNFPESCVGSKTPLFCLNSVFRVDIILMYFLVKIVKWRGLWCIACVNVCVSVAMLATDMSVLISTMTVKHVCSKDEMQHLLSF